MLPQVSWHSRQSSILVWYNILFSNRTFLVDKSSSVQLDFTMDGVNTLKTLFNILSIFYFWMLFTFVLIVAKVFKIEWIPDWIYHVTLVGLVILLIVVLTTISIYILKHFKSIYVIKQLQKPS
jgi:hypothetical protein